MSRKKMYYLPGLISLVGLPIIFLFFVPPDKPEPVVLRFFLPNDRKDDQYLSKYSVWKHVEKKKKLSIEFWQNDSSYLSEYRKISKIDYISGQIRQLTFEHDTNTVLKIELGEGLTYGDFVKILDQLLVYDVKQYALTDNTFYIFANKPPLNPYVPPPPGEEEVQLLYCGYVSSPQTRPAEMISLVNLSSRRLLFLIGFILLIIIPGLLRVKKILL